MNPSAPATRRSTRLVALSVILLLLAAITPASPANALDGTETIAIFAGEGTVGYSGDGGPALDAQLEKPTVIAVAPDGSVYFVDADGTRIRRVRNGVISTVAGETATTGIGDPAISLQSFFDGIAVGPDGLVYFADFNSDRIAYIDASGIVRLFAGDGTSGYSGDGGDATLAQLRDPNQLAFGPDGSLFFSDRGNSRIRMVDTAGTITTVGGTGDEGFSGDGGPATAAKLDHPTALTVDWYGNVYFTDYYNSRIRKIDTDGVVSTVIGTGTAGLPRPPAGGAPGTSVDVDFVNELAIDGSNQLHAAIGSVIIKLDRDGIVTVVARTIGQDTDASASADLAGYIGGLAFASNGDAYVSTKDLNAFAPGHQNLVYRIEAPDNCRRGPVSTKWETDHQTRATVYRLYCAYFLRFPDHGGYDYWYDIFNSQQLSLAEISDLFADSAEFKNAYGSLTNGDFLDLLYGNVMQRAADQGGRAYWLGILDGQILTKGDVLLQFSESQEFRNKTGTP